MIIRAGAFDSPQLLLLSGIGAAEHMESFGISVVTDLPGVGKICKTRKVDLLCATLFYGEW
jgi:choline dehydrogenase-like flavoprotein